MITGIDNGPDISGIEQSTPDTSADRAIDAKSSLKSFKGLKIHCQPTKTVLSIKCLQTVTSFV